MCLAAYDYSQDGCYFVTMCTHDRACLFGRVVDGLTQPNELGCIVEEEWILTASLPYRTFELGRLLLHWMEVDWRHHSGNQELIWNRELLLETARQ